MGTNQTGIWPKPMQSAHWLPFTSHCTSIISETREKNLNFESFSLTCFCCRGCTSQHIMLLVALTPRSKHSHKQSQARRLWTRDSAVPRLVCHCVCMCTCTCQRLHRACWSDICQSAHQDQSVICQLFTDSYQSKLVEKHDWSRQERGLGEGVAIGCLLQKERLGRMLCLQWEMLCSCRQFDIQ